MKSNITIRRMIIKQGIGIAEKKCKPQMPILTLSNIG